MEKEIWKDIPDTDGKFQVSNMGRVRSRCKKNEWRIRIPDHNHYGYAMIHFHFGSKNYRRFVHRLVAFAFCDGYKPGLVVNHKDENPLNNRADNLEWVTIKYNNNYGSRIEKVKESLRAKKSLHSKLRKVEKVSTEKNLQGEEWRNITGYEGIYMVSNMGRVKSLKRLHINGGIMRQYVSGYSQMKVHLCGSDGKHHEFAVSRLVAREFCVGYNESLCVKHIDGDVKNNCAFNLEWTTMKEARNDSLRTAKSGISLRKAVIQMDMEGNFIAEYSYADDAVEALGMPRSKSGKIRECCRGIMPTAYGYKWKYKNEKK